MPTRKTESSSTPETLDAPALPQIDEESPGDVADMTEQPAEESQEKDVVRYLGIFSERRILKEDWEQAGVSDQGGVVWTKGTGNTVSIDQFTEDALRVLSHSPEFQVVR